MSLSGADWNIREIKVARVSGHNLVSVGHVNSDGIAGYLVIGMWYFNRHIVVNATGVRDGRFGVIF